MKNAPQFVEHYNSKLAAAKNIEVLHVNLDSGEEAMRAFAAAHKFSFPVISREDADKSKILKGLSPSGVPSYKLVDAQGKVIAEGGEAKSKADEIAEGKLPS